MSTPVACCLFGCVLLLLAGWDWYDGLTDRYVLMGALGVALLCSGLAGDRNA